jgi:mRNA interferase MazF
MSGVHSGQGLSTQVALGVDEGLKHDGVIFCDNLVSVAKLALTDYVGALAPTRIEALDRALRIALDL